MKKAATPKFNKKAFTFSTRMLAFTGLMTAMVFVCTSFLNVNTGNTFTNVGDSVIFITAYLFGPIPAMIAGGFGSFFADLYVYPATMWYTLIIKGIEGLICGLIMLSFKKLNKNKYTDMAISFFAMLVSALFMIGGYYISKAFFYGTPAKALVSLASNAVQGSLSVAIAFSALFILQLKTLKQKLHLEITTKKPQDEQITIGDFSKTLESPTKNQQTDFINQNEKDESDKSNDDKFN